MPNLQELPRFRDGLSYLYVEQARIEQDAKAIACYHQDGKISVPASSLALLMLGPGTSISHAAIKVLADSGCLVNWVGEEMVRYYASGLGETRSSQNLLKQAETWANPQKRLQIVRHMYGMRFEEALDPRLSLQQIRGKEGVRVRTAYDRASKATGVPWHGRSYQRGQWGNTDPINRALSAGAACLYGVCHAAIVSAGFSPALGFIH
ncbi:MAG: type I-E CRISPR-associated endonuclease Cas1e, partial [Deinococcales bacterium]